MGKWIELQNQQQENKEKNKTRREKLAGFFFDLAKLCFATVVLGGFTPLFTNHANGDIRWEIILSGTAATVLFAVGANRILK